MVKNPFVFKEAIEYAKSREQFGQPIGNFQMIKQIIANRVASTEATHYLVCRADRVRHLPTRGKFNR